MAKSNEISIGLEDGVRLVFDASSGWVDASAGSAKVSKWLDKREAINLASKLLQWGTSS